RTNWAATPPSRRGRVSTAPLAHRTRTDEDSRDEPALPKARRASGLGIVAGEPNRKRKRCRRPPRQRLTSVPRCRQRVVLEAKFVSGSLPLRNYRYKNYSVPIKY